MYLKSRRTGNPVHLMSKICFFSINKYSRWTVSREAVISYSSERSKKFVSVISFIVSFLVLMQSDRFNSKVSSSQVPFLEMVIWGIWKAWQKCEPTQRYTTVHISKEKYFLMVFQRYWRAWKYIDGARLSSQFLGYYKCIFFHFLLLKKDILILHNLTLYRYIFIKQVNLLER